MALEPEELKNLAMDGRKLLIAAFSSRCPESDSNCAYALTQYAIKHQFVAPRSPIPGRTLQSWRGEKSPTEWACKAACALVLSDGYEPRAPAEWAAVVYYWTLGHGPFSSVEAALQSFPAYLDREMLQHYLSGFPF